MLNAQTKSRFAVAALDLGPQETPEQQAERRARRTARQSARMVERRARLQRIFSEQDAERARRDPKKAPPMRPKRARPWGRWIACLSAALFVAYPLYFAALAQAAPALSGWLLLLWIVVVAVPALVMAGVYLISLGFRICF